MPGPVKNPTAFLYFVVRRRQEITLNFEIAFKLNTKESRLD